MNGTHAVLEEHLRAGRLDPAEAMARHLLGQDGDDEIAHIAWARISAARGNVDDGIKRLERLLTQNPKQPDALAHLAVMWREKGDVERALLLARRAVSLGAHVPQNDVMLGEDAIDRGALDEALRFFDRAISKNVKTPMAWVGRGRVMHAQDFLADAEDAFARAVEIAPLKVEAWTNLIEVELEGGADDAADDNLALALKAHPGNLELLAIKARADRQRQNLEDPLDLALTAVRNQIYAGDIDGAKRALYQLMTDFPGDTRTTIVEAELSAITGDGDIPGIMHTLMRMVRDRPTQWAPRAALGRIMLRNGPMQNLRMGLAQCEEAWRTSGQHPRAGLFVFEAFAVTGKRALALALGQQLAALDVPEASLVKQLLSQLQPKTGDSKSADVKATDAPAKTDEATMTAAKPKPSLTRTGLSPTPTKKP